MAPGGCASLRHFCVGLDDPPGHADGYRSEGRALCLELGATPREAINRQELQQILVNLTVHATKAVPEGGTLTICTLMQGLWQRMCDESDVITTPLPLSSIPGTKARSRRAGASKLTSIVVHQVSSVRAKKSPTGASMAPRLLMRTSRPPHSDSTRSTRVLTPAESPRSA